MDPNLFHIDWERMFEALAGVVVLSFFVERVCAPVFESRWWIGRFEDERVGASPGPPAHPEDQTSEKAEAKKAAAKKTGDKKTDDESGKEESPQSEKLLVAQQYPIKEVLAFVLAVAVCWTWDFDAVSIILLSKETHLFGVIVTAGVVSGGSKGSIRLFQDLLGFMSQAQRERKALRQSAGAK